MTKEQGLYSRFHPSLSYVKQFNAVSDLQKESATFLWFQLLMVMIENMNNNQAAIEDMLSYARTQYEDNKVILEKITELDEQFTDSGTKFDAIAWYTENIFVSKLVNNELKREDYMVLH